MQREIAKVIGRLNFQVAPIDVQQPAERSHSKHRETDCDSPKPKTAIAHQRERNICILVVLRFGNFSLLLFRGGVICDLVAGRPVTSSKKSGNSKRGATY